MQSDQQHSDFIFFADESGDHSLTSVDSNYPVFVLSLCGFKKASYCSRTVPNFQRLKFKYFGHDAVVLHEHDIRKQNGEFRILTNPVIREHFMEDLSSCIVRSPFKIFSAAILKPHLRLDLFPENPYVICLRIVLQNAFLYLSAQHQLGRQTHFIFEKRGKKEDDDLELEFRRITSGANDLRQPLHDFVIHFSDKRTNSTGMQIADLTARPIGLHFFNGEQSNRAYDLIRPKLSCRKKFSDSSRGIYVP